MKKIFILFAAVLTAMTIQAEQVYYTCGESMEGEFNTGSGALYLVGTGAMYNYISSASTPWTSKLDKILNVYADSRSQYTSIGNNAFADCSKLEKVVLPSTVTSIGENAFRKCSSLTTINIPNDVTTIGDYAFFLCSALKSITIGDGVKTVGAYAFQQCTALTTLTLGSSLKTISEYAFSFCDALASVDIPNSVTTIGISAFSTCPKLATVTIGKGVTSIGNNAFSNCTALTSITVAEQNANYCSADGVLFNEDKTTLITYPCAKSGEYTVPNTVTKISMSAFRKCVALTAVTIPTGVKNIDYDAFSECTGLTSITCYATTPPTCGVDAFKNVSKTIPLNVPYGCKSAYENAASWSEFINIVEMAPTSLDQINQKSQIKNQKSIKNGVLYIEKDGHLFNAQGARVE